MRSHATQPSDPRFKFRLDYIKGTLLMLLHLSFFTQCLLSSSFSFVLLIFLNSRPISYFNLISSFRQQASSLVFNMQLSKVFLLPLLALAASSVMSSEAQAQSLAAGNMLLVGRDMQVRVQRSNELRGFDWKVDFLSSFLNPVVTNSLFRGVE